MYRLKTILFCIVCAIGSTQALAQTDNLQEADVVGEAESTYQGAANSGVKESANPDSYDIVVTAQKRSERLGDVPIAISAFSGDALAQKGVANIRTCRTSSLACA